MNLIVEDIPENSDTDSVFGNGVQITDVVSIKEEPIDVDESEISYTEPENEGNNSEIAMQITSVKEEPTESEDFNKQMEEENNLENLEIKKEPSDNEAHEICDNDACILSIKEESIEKVFIKEEPPDLEDENLEPEEKLPVCNENSIGDLIPIDFKLMKIKNEVTFGQEHEDNNENSGVSLRFVNVMFN